MISKLYRRLIGKTRPTDTAINDDLIYNERLVSIFSNLEFNDKIISIFVLSWIKNGFKLSVGSMINNYKAYFDTVDDYFIACFQIGNLLHDFRKNGSTYMQIVLDEMPDLLTEDELHGVEEHRDLFINNEYNYHTMEAKRLKPLLSKNITAAADDNEEADRLIEEYMNRKLNKKDGDTRK
jgi:hypothetical protein